MKRILICPGERAAVGRLAEHLPFSNTPLLGQGLLEYWLTHLAASGAKQVTVLANDRVAAVRDIAGNGARWGIATTVIEESRELSVAQALIKYEKDLDPVSANDGIFLMDHFPGAENAPLFGSYADWFNAVLKWMPRAKTVDRVGIHETSPGVWRNLNARIAPNAQFKGPCWIGKNVFIGAGVVLGPNTVVEDGAFIEPGAAIAQSWIGPDTFVGKFAEITESLASGSTLLNWKTNSVLEVPDPFLLCSLRRPRLAQSAGLLTRLSELYSRNKEEVQELWKHLLLGKQG